MLNASKEVRSAVGSKIRKIRIDAKPGLEL